MSDFITVRRRLSGVFEQKQAQILTEVIFDSYQELVKANDFNELKGIVKELAVAQKRTEGRLEELAAAQERTEEALATLTTEHKETRRQLGGLAMTVGYTLENRAYRAIPALLKRDYGIIVEDRLIRRYVKDAQGKEVEVNIIGQGRSKDGQTLTIIGESKSQLSQNNIDRFLRRRVERLQGAFGNIFPVLVTHMISSATVADYAKEKNVALYYSYDFE